MTESQKPGNWDEWKAKHPGWYELVVLGLLSIAVSIAGVLFVVLIWLFIGDGWSTWSKNRENVRDLILIFAGIAGVPFVIWREYSTHRAAKAAERQADTSADRHEKQTKADTERRITDNFTKAIELLGSEKLHVRIGGIYALERIAHESERDHWPIMETLTTYVRDNGKARRHNTKQEDQEILEEEVDTNKEKVEISDELEEKQYGYSNVIGDRSPDIDAILKVLSRRMVKYEKNNQKIHLPVCNMWRVDWQETSFIGANFSGANLIWAKLTGSDLREIWLQEANLNEAELIGADLRGADLSMANLIEANFSGADLRGADLSAAGLCEANLTGANLAGAILSGADLTGTCLFKADLTGAILEDREAFWGGLAEGANLSDAKFCKTTMPDGTLNNRDCPTEPPPPNPSETPAPPN